MSKKVTFELNNHLNKCRVCLLQLNDNDKRTKITKVIRERFQNLTQIELKSSDSYSNVICKDCNIQLRNFMNFCRDSVMKQKSLIQLVEATDEMQEFDTNLITVKSEDNPNSMLIKVEPLEMQEIYNDDYVNTEYLDNLLEEINNPEKPSRSKRNAKNETPKNANSVQCGLCGNYFHKTHMQQHINSVHKKITRFFCDICNYGTYQKNKLGVHMIKHIARANREQINCTLCDATFTRQESLRSHMRTDHQTTGVHTCFCGQEFNVPNKLSAHIRKNHRDWSVVETLKDEPKAKRNKTISTALCGFCGKHFHKTHIQNHINNFHKRIKRFFCDICNYGTYQKNKLGVHMIKHIAREFRDQIKCTLCNVTFTRQESLRTHMRTDHREQEVHTCFCGKTFNLPNKLTIHIKRKHQNIRNHECQQCDKKFYTPKELKIHVLKKHTPGYVHEKSNIVRTVHFCEICGNKYSGEKGLKAHMLQHQEPAFKCNYAGCQKAYVSKLLLKTHEKIHIGQKDHACDQCDKSFFVASHLKRHKAVSHEKVLMKCLIEGCRFSVGRKDYLRNHIMTHRELSEEVKNELLLKVRKMKLPW